MSSELSCKGMTLKEQSKPYVWIMLIAAGFNFGLNFYFIPNFGFVGAAITTIISNLIYFAISYYWSQRVFYIRRSIFRPMLYIFIGLSIAIFFPFYEFKIGSHISYYIKLIVIISILTLPFILKIIEFNWVIEFSKQLKAKSG